MKRNKTKLAHHVCDANYELRLVCANGLSSKRPC